MLSSSSALLEHSTTELVWMKGQIVYHVLVAMFAMNGVLSDQTDCAALGISAEKVLTLRLLTLETRQTSVLQDITVLKALMIPLHVQLVHTAQQSAFTLNTSV